MTIKEQHKKAIEEAVNTYADPRIFLDKSAEECSAITEKACIDYVHWVLNRMTLVPNNGINVNEETEAKKELFRTYQKEKGI